MDKERKEELQIVVTEKMQDEDFCKGLVECENIEKMYQYLNGNGIEITVEEVAEFKSIGDEDLRNKSAEELTAEDLDNVSGGGWIRRSFRFLGAATLGAGIGFACGVCPALTPIAVPYAVGAAIWVSQG